MKFHAADTKAIFQYYCALLLSTICPE